MRDDQVAGEEQALVVHLRLSGDRFGDGVERDRVWELEDLLSAAIDEAQVGEYDGNEFGEGEAVLSMYGPSADSLLAAVEPLVRSFAPQAGSFAIKRYGSADDPAVHEERVPLC